MKTEKQILAKLRKLDDIAEGLDMLEVPGMDTKHDIRTAVAYAKVEMLQWVLGAKKK